MSTQNVTTTKVSKLIKKASMHALLIDMIPIPGSDASKLKAIQIKLAKDIGHIYGIVLKKDEILHLMATYIVGGIGIRVARYGIDAIKAAGWIPGDQVAEVCACLASGTIAG